MPLKSTLGALREQVNIGVNHLGDKYWVDVTDNANNEIGTGDNSGNYHFFTSTNKLVLIDERNIAANIDLMTGTIPNLTSLSDTSMSVNGNIITLGYRGANLSNTNFSLGAVFINNGVGNAGMELSSNVGGTPRFGNVVVDSYNNYFICGQLGGNGVIAKYDSSKTLQWQRKPTYTGSNAIISINDAVSDGSNTYAVGFTTNSANIVATRNGILIKISNTGNLLWSANLSNNFQPELISFIDSSSNLIIAGAERISNQGSIAKVDLDGTLITKALITANTIYSNNQAPITCLSVDTNNNVVVGGQYLDSTYVPQAGLFTGYIMGFNSTLTSTRFKKKVVAQNPSNGAARFTLQNISQVADSAIFITGATPNIMGVNIKTVYNGNTLGSGNYVVGNAIVRYVDTTQFDITYNNTAFTTGNVVFSTSTLTNSITTTALTSSTLTIDKKFI